MRTLVVYATRHGNTRRIAEIVADTLRAQGEVVLAPAEAAPSTAAGFDLVVVGGPTEQRAATPAIADYLDRVEVPHGLAAAAFDTRLRGPRLIWGSAAHAIAGRLRDRGARLVAREESFFVNRRALGGETPELEPGELQRASAWALRLPVLAPSS